MRHPKIRGQSVYDLAESLQAYDLGATDSGLKDDIAKEELRLHLKSLSPGKLRMFWAVMVNRYLAPNALEGYGLADVRKLCDWAEEQGFPF